MKITSFVFCLLLGSLSATAADFYASPTGSSGGNGSVLLPWDLQTALQQPASVVKPGDTVWLRGGIYTRAKLWSIYRSTLMGSEGAPVTVQAVPGERVTIEGSLFQWSGGWVVYQGFELRNSYSHRYTTQPASHPTAFTTYINGETVDMNVSGVDIRAPNIKLLNLTVHDHIGGGFGVNPQAPGCQILDCLSFYNGWVAVDRAHGHGLYGQMAEPGVLVVKNSVFYGNFALGIQSYGAIDHLTDNLILEGNTIFLNGILPPAHQQNLVIGPWSGTARNPVVVDNCVYDTRGSSSDNFFGYNGGMLNGFISGNYFQTSVMLSQSRPGLILVNNTFLKPLLLFADEPYPQIPPSDYPFNTYLTSPPTENFVRVRPSLDQPGRVMVTIYNWENLDSVEVDLSGHLTPGVTYEVRNAQDADLPVFAFTFAGGTLMLPMTGLTVAAPVSGPAPISSAPAFAVFLISPLGAAGSSHPYNTPPTISPVHNAFSTLDSTTIPWNEISTWFNITVGDAESAPETLALYATSSNPTLLTPANITFGGSGADRTFRFRTETGQYGSTTVRLVVSDGTNQSSSAFNILVTHPNFPPQISPVPDLTLEPNRESEPIPFTVSDVETSAGDLLVFCYVSDYGLFPESGQTLRGTDGNWVLTLTPQAGMSGTATVLLRVYDNMTYTDRSFAVTVRPPESSDISAGLVAHLPFDEASGMAFADATGHGNNATLTTGYYYTTPGPAHIPGRIGAQALFLNGLDRYRNGDYVAVSPTDRLNAGAGDFSLAFWLKTAINSDAVILAKYSRAGMESGYLLAVDGASNNGKLRLRITDGITARTFKGTQKVNDGAWHHIGVTLDRAGALTRFYVDGALSSSAPGNNAGNLNTSAGFAFGKACGSYAGWLAGALDDFRFYGRVLSGAEMAMLAQVVPVNTPPTISPIADVILPEGTGHTVVFQISDAETPTGDLRLALRSSNEELLPPHQDFTIGGRMFGMTLGSDAAGPKLFMAPRPEDGAVYGVAIITIIVSDGEVSTETSFRATVDARPAISGIADVEMDENTVSAPIPVTISDMETPVNNLTLYLLSSSPTLLPASGVTFGGSGANRTFTLRPTPGQFGEADLTICVSDGVNSVGSGFHVQVTHVPTPPSGDGDLNLGLAAHYTFDEASGTTFGDASGNGNACSLFTGFYTTTPVPSHVPGKVGSGAYYMNGVDRYYSGEAAEVNATSRLNLGTASFSFTAWIKTSAATDEVLAGKYARAGMEAGWLLCVDGGSNAGKLRLRVSDGVSGAKTFKGTQKVNDGAWHHVAVVVDRAASTTSFYVDGVVSTVAAGSLGGSLDNWARFAIGKSCGAYGGWFLGAVDDARIYSRALTPAEMVILANPTP